MDDTNIAPDPVVYFEITPSKTNHGFLYAMFVDYRGEPIVVASGHEKSLKPIFDILCDVTERTL